MNFYTAHDVVFLTSAVLAQWRGVPPYKESSAWSWFGSALRISSTQLTDEHEIKTRILNMYYILYYSVEKSHITDRQTTSREPVKKENQRSCSHFQCSLVSYRRTIGQFCSSIDTKITHCSSHSPLLAVFHGAVDGVTCTANDVTLGPTS